MIIMLIIAAYAAAASSSFLFASATFSASNLSFSSYIFRKRSASCFAANSAAIRFFSSSLQTTSSLLTRSYSAKYSVEQS